MPTYEYKCFACDHVFEEFQSITAKPIKRCPQCGKSKVKRLLGTGAGLIFKGSGFYITDYRSESYKSSAKADSGSGTSGEAKSGDAKPSGETPAKTETSTKSEAPAAAKSESKPAKKSKDK